MFYDGHPQAEPGAIVCRAAPSFIRFGNFELPASRGDTALLKTLVDFCIRRDFPHLGEPGERVYGQWFAEVAQRTATLMAHWMRVGFVHGVMNTDNLSILGLTIDYGPYGWVDDYDPDWTPNTTDAGRRRYRYGQQPQVAYWNLSRLAGALSPLIATELLQDGLRRYVEAYNDAERDAIARKLGLRECGDEDVALMQELRGWLQANEVDMTIFYRALADIDVAAAAPDPSPLAEAYYDPTRAVEAEPALRDWLARYAARSREDGSSAAERVARMNAANPRYVLRNYLAQKAIDRAEQGDPAGVRDLLEVMRRPYEDQPGREAFAAKRPDWARERAGCSMLSCSS
jgi:uncharacterized protein YdiU (UPF0061 family)